MNNNAFNIGFGQNDLRASLAARGYKTAGEQAAEKAAEAPKEEPKKEENNNTDQIASALGNRMLRDLGAFMLNPVAGSAAFNGQMFKTMINAPFALMNNQKKEEPKAEEPAAEPAAEEPAEEPAKEEDATETVEYTYKPGDTFGQVVRDLGLESGNGLWGENGDVEYYTQQLMQQGIWPEGTRGNIPIGTTIKLKRRPYTQEMIEYRKQNGLD